MDGRAMVSREPARAHQLLHPQLGSRPESVGRVRARAADYDEAQIAPPARRLEDRGRVLDPRGVYQRLHARESARSAAASPASARTSPARLRSSRETRGEPARTRQRTSCPCASSRSRSAPPSRPVAPVRENLHGSPQRREDIRYGGGAFDPLAAVHPPPTISTETARFTSFLVT